MNKDLLKSLIPGLIPLFVFIAADEIWGTQIGLIVAVAFGLLELAFTYIRSKKIEKMILIDILMLSALGGVSIIFDNDIFFKLKPAILELILAAILGVSVFTPKNIVMAMSQRYMKGLEMNDAAARQMDKNLKALFFIVVIHIGMVIYSAYFMSKEAWAFVSGILLYAIFGAWFLYQLVKTKYSQKKHSNEEYLPIVDNKGKVIGTAPRSKCHGQKKKLLHPVVHLHIFDKKGRLLLQKRAGNKLVQPNKWDTSVGGHISANETLEVALVRETMEEVGLELKNMAFLQHYQWESDIEKELVYVFAAITSDKPVANKEEVDELRFWTIKDIEKQFNKDVLTPNFEYEYQLIGLDGLFKKIDISKVGK